MRKFLVVLCLVGCTKGGVWSAADLTQPVPAASITVSDLTEAGVTQHIESSEAGWRRNHFALGPRAFDSPWAGTELAPERWYRYQVSREGFEPRVFYRYHPGYADACEFRCPDGSTSCCHREDFALWPVGTPHLAAPDLVVDHQTLAEQTYVQCVNLGGGADPDVIAVRASVRVANIGDGDLRVESARPGVACHETRPCAPGFGCIDGICAPNLCDAGERSCPGELVCSRGTCVMPACWAGEECRSDRCGADGRCEPVVQQRLTGAAGLPDRLERLETYMFNDGRTSELLAFAALHVVPAACTKEDPGDCDRHDLPHRTFCIEAEERFDLALDGPPPLTSFDGCAAGTQILGVGQAVMLAHHEPGQVFVLGDPETARAALAEPLTVVASVDPSHVLTERTMLVNGAAVEERGNNRVRIPLRAGPIADLLDLPALCRDSVSPACDDCVPILDCSQCQAGQRDGVIHRCAMAPNLTDEEEEMCGDYPPAFAMTSSTLRGAR